MMFETLLLRNSGVSFCRHSARFGYQKVTLQTLPTVSLKHCPLFYSNTAHCFNETLGSVANLHFALKTLQNASKC